MTLLTSESNLQTYDRDDKNIVFSRARHIFNNFFHLIIVSNIRHKSLSNVVSCLPTIVTIVSFPLALAFFFFSPKTNILPFAYITSDLSAFGGFPIIGWIIPIIHLHPQFYPSELVSMLICHSLPRFYT